MIPVSEQFTAATTATVRRPKGRIDVIWTDPFIDPTIGVFATQTNRAAILPQVADNNIITSRKWLHLDGSNKLDGTYYPMPDSSGGGQVGYYGSGQCDASGNFTTPPVITVTFASRPVYSLLVSGDTEYNEYPVDFNILIYSGSTLSHTEAVTGNDSVRWSKDISDLRLFGIDRIVLQITKWSLGNRVPKINEFYTSIVDTYDGDTVVSMNLLEERIISDGTLPIGNISANEIDIELQNIKVNGIVDPFFPDNPDSPLAQFVRKNRKIIPYVGFKLPDQSIEYVRLGTFWTGDWTVNEEDSIVSVSARDRMELLRKAEYPGSTLYEDITLYNLMNNILVHARDNIPMKDLIWQIDTELQDYTVPYAWLEKASYFNTIKQIVEACMGQAYMSKSDVLIIEGPSKTIR